MHLKHPWMIQQVSAAKRDLLESAVPFNVIQGRLSPLFLQPISIDDPFTHKTSSWVFPPSIVANDADGVLEVRLNPGPDLESEPSSKGKNVDRHTEETRTPQGVYFKDYVTKYSAPVEEEPSPSAEHTNEQRATPGLGPQRLLSRQTSLTFTSPQVDAMPDRESPPHLSRPVGRQAKAKGIKKAAHLSLGRGDRLISLDPNAANKSTDGEGWRRWTDQHTSNPTQPQQTSTQPIQANLGALDEQRPISRQSQDIRPLPSLHHSGSSGSSSDRGPPNGGGGRSGPPHNARDPPSPAPPNRRPPRHFDRGGGGPDPDPSDHSDEGGDNRAHRDR